MLTNLKLTAQLLAKKYSWHTLGENVIPCTRNIMTGRGKKDIPTPTPTPKSTRTKSNPTDESVVPKASRKKVNTDHTPLKKVLRETTSTTQILVQKIVTFKPNTKSKRLIAERTALTQEVYKEYNEAAFDGLLPPDMMISWNKRLTSTAGITKMSSQSRNTIKVITT